MSDRVRCILVLLGCSSLFEALTYTLTSRNGLQLYCVWIDLADVEVTGAWSSAVLLLVKLVGLDVGHAG